VRPSVILIIDGFTRAIMGLNFSFNHTTDDALVALRHALSLDEAIGPFRGAADVLRFDNGAEFLSRGFTDALTMLGIYAWEAHPYTPTQKAKVERLNRTLGDEFWADLPYAVKTPRTANHKVPYGPDVDPPDIQRLAEELREYVRRYNTERPHSALGGQTPAQAWQADPTPLRACSDSELRLLLKRRAVRKIQKEGIHFQSDVFWADELNGLVSEEVEIAYWGLGWREIDVYRDRAFLCTARPKSELSASERVRFLQKRKEDKKRSATERRKASRRQRLRYITEGLGDGSGYRRRDVTGKPREQRRPAAPEKKPPNPLLGLDEHRTEPRDTDA
jgi:putative transposase